jgi:hypothetical protein
MKRILITILLATIAFPTFPQCDCDKIDQKNGTFYTICKPFAMAEDSIGEFKLGVSGLGESRYIHLTLSFKDTGQVFNGGLTITTTDGKGWICVMIQRDLSMLNGVQTAFGLFVTTDFELKQMDSLKIKSISYYLADGIPRTCTVKYLNDQFKTQIECIKK